MSDLFGGPLEGRAASKKSMLFADFEASLNDVQGDRKDEGSRKLLPFCEESCKMAKVRAFRQWTNAYVYNAVASTFFEDNLEEQTQRILGMHRAGATVLTAALKNYRRKVFRRTVTNFRLNVIMSKVSEKSTAVIRETMDERHGVLAKSRAERELLTAKLDRQQKEVSALIAQAKSEKDSHSREVKSVQDRERDDSAKVLAEKEAILKERLEVIARLEAEKYYISREAGQKGQLGKKGDDINQHTAVLIESRLKVAVKGFNRAMSMGFRSWLFFWLKDVYSPSGVNLNYETMYTESKGKIQALEEEIQPWRQRALLETAVKETCSEYTAEKKDGLDVSVQQFITTKWAKTIPFPCWLRRGASPGAYSYNTLEFTVTGSDKSLMVGKETLREYLLDTLPKEYESKPHPMAIRLAHQLRHGEETVKSHFDNMLLADDTGLDREQFQVWIESVLESNCDALSRQILDQVFSGLPVLEDPTATPTASFDSIKVFFLAAVSEQLTQKPAEGPPTPAGKAGAGAGKAAAGAKPAAAGNKGAAAGAKRATSAAKKSPAGAKKKK